jgi:hypothetical protein
MFEIEIANWKVSCASDPSEAVRESTSESAREEVGEGRRRARNAKKGEEAW